jgi:hypothetical protein
MVRLKNRWHQYLNTAGRTDGHEKFYRDYHVKWKKNRIKHVTNKKTNERFYTAYGKAKQRKKHNRRKRQEYEFKVWANKRDIEASREQQEMEETMTRDLVIENERMLTGFYKKPTEPFFWQNPGHIIQTMSPEKRRNNLYKRSNIVPSIQPLFIPDWMIENELKPDKVLQMGIRRRKYQRDEHPHNRFMRGIQEKSGKKIFMNIGYEEGNKRWNRYVRKHANQYGTNLKSRGMKGRTAWKIGYQAMLNDHKARRKAELRAKFGPIKK